MLPHVSGYQERLDEDDIPFAFENVKNIKWYDKILLNRPLRITIVLVLSTILAPVLVYQFIFLPTLQTPPPDGHSTGSCLVPRAARLPCGLEAVPPEQCHEQCCYDHQNDLCFHRYPSRFSYLFRGRWTEQTYLNPRMPTIPYGNQKSYTNVRLSVDEVTATHLTFTFYHSNNIIGRRLREKNYTYSILEPIRPHPNEMELNIIVNSTQGNIFNTARGPLIAADNIWEISFKLTNETMYGLGEIPLKPGTVKVLYNHMGGLNSIPLIFAKFNGSYHGLLIESLAPTEVIVRGDNQLVLRSITYLGLKFHLFVGPKPVDVMKDAMTAIGVKKSNLEYWMLGAHVCREATSRNPLEELQTFISLATSQGVPYESHCGAVPVVFETECNSTMVTLVDQGAIQIKNARKKFIPHVSPYIKYTAPAKPVDEESEEDDETAEAETTTKIVDVGDGRCFDDAKYAHYNLRDPVAYQLYKGKVDEHDVIYPGYKWASEKFMKTLWIFNTDFDAVILENSWPLDESEKDRESFYEYLPYFNEHFEAAFNVTPKWNATRPTRSVSRNTRLTNDTEYPGEQYLIRHNEYGNQFVSAFEKIKGAIPTLSTSQWLNYNVTINSQNVSTSWTNLRKELIEASLGGVSGHWHWSSPICGDTEDFNNVTQIRLCAKWYMAATFMPRIKIHSKVIPRDPLAFDGSDRAHMIKALNWRLSFLPYFYTVLQDGPLLRPMFYQFPSSNLTDITSQFAVGDDLLIVPNLEPSQTHIHFWMPPGTWYDFWGGLKIIGKEGHAVTMTTTDADFFTLVRAGSIIILQKETQLSADLTRLQSGYSLIIALECETKISTATTEITSTTEYTTIETTEADVESTSNVTTDDSETISTTETATTGQTDDEEDSTGQTDDGEDTTGETDDGEDTSTTEAPVNTITTCEASGKLFMNENMTLTFKANTTTITVTAEKKNRLDFAVFCNDAVATWAGTVREVAIYGLDKKENNYDEKKLISNIAINLCQLILKDEITFKFVDV